MIESQTSLLPALPSPGKGKPPEIRKLRAFCVGVAPHALEELELLLETLQVEVVGSTQFLARRISPGTYLGEGKLEEIQVWLGDAKPGTPEARADFVVVDHELAPKQLQNIEKFLGGIPILDRPGVILEIFSRNARSKESKTQVELARLQYLLPRLAHFWSHFERQRGGMKNKGMGEKQIEVDRRLIKRRMAMLENRLKEIGKERGLKRAQRKEILKVALVGYTNAGKSTLLNALTSSQVLAKDALFATLDASVRLLSPNSHPPVVAIDTVGFVSRLPHNLVASFRSTLEEVQEADFLLHVVDGSSGDAAHQIRVTEEVLAELGVEETPRLVVLNKMDRVADPQMRLALRAQAPGALTISALDRSQVATLRDRILSHFQKQLPKWECVIPYAESKLESQIHALGQVEKTQFLENGTYFRVRMEEVQVKKLKLERFLLSSKRSRSAGILGLLLWLAGVSGAQADPFAGPLPLDLRYEEVPAEGQGARPLSTEELHELAPGELGHPLRTWWLSRKLELSQVEISRKGGRVHFSSQGIVSRSQLRLRAPGPPWQELEKFPCERWNALQVFSSIEGARVAAKFAQNQWEKLLKSEETLLTLKIRRLLQSVPASEPLDQVQKRLGLEFQAWVRMLESRFRTQILPQARREEWRFYERERKCTPKVSLHKVLRKDLLESRSLPEVKPRYRVPAYLWGGLPVVRVTLKLGEGARARTTVGRFLVDPSATHSLVSLALAATIPLIPQDYELVGLVDYTWAHGRGHAKWIRGPKLEISGVDLGMEGVGLAELTSEPYLRKPAQFMDECCDGVLGRDWFEDVTLEWTPPQFGPKPNNPSALLTMPFHDVRRGVLEVFSSNGYQRKGLSEWIEVSQVRVQDQVEWVSLDCRVDQGNKRAWGVHWDFRDREGIDLEVGVSGASSSLPWQVQCGNTLLGPSLPAKRVAILSQGSTGWAQARALRSFLWRGPMTLDLRNGKIWFSREWLEEPASRPMTAARALAKFGYSSEGERQLRIQGLALGKVAGNSASAVRDLEQGVVLEVESVRARHLDRWWMRQLFDRWPLHQPLLIRWRGRDGEDRSSKFFLENLAEFSSTGTSF